MVHVLFAPGLFAISFFGPWTRAVLVLALFAAAAAAAGLMGVAAVTPWLLFALAVYVFGAVVEWGQIGVIRIRRTMERIASGDLSVRIELKNTRGSDAIRMWRSIDSMSTSLAGIVREVNESSGVIGKAAHEVGQGYQNLSRRTEEQAATLEETASSTEELTATVRQNAESCSRARELAAEASGVAGRAAEAMRRMTGTMGRIEGSSRRVTEISTVIESIAFQTNILALNAAVEAARAGEHGRGFAVVAAEVRDLAQRCSVAAKEIRQVIGESSTAVAEGGKIAGEAAGTIDRAVASVHAVSEQIDAIARASTEQSTGIEGISKAIQQLDGVTAQNAALVEQTGAAARAFEEQTARLVEVVGFFKVDLSKEREAAVEMVKKGIARMHTAGYEAAFLEFEDRNGGFRRGGNYLWVCDMKGIVRCHGTYPKSRNQNHADLKDANGKLFIRDVLRIAAERGQGWVDYQYHNPATKQVEPKSTYFERDGDLIVLCGVYRREGRGVAEAAAALPAANKGARNQLVLR